MAFCREFTSVETLNEQYLPGASGLTTCDIFAWRDTDSTRAKSVLDAKSDVRFGPTIDEYVFPVVRAKPRSKCSSTADTGSVFRRGSFLSLPAALSKAALPSS